MIYTYANSDLRDILSHYGMSNDRDYPTWLLEYKTLSPDSCIWILGDEFNYDDTLTSATYVLYAEDYIESLEQVIQTIESSTNLKVKSLVEAADRITFADSDPIKSSVVYKIPDDTNEIEKYAATKGYFFTFLAKVEAL